MRDIAEAAGVHVMTVSNALSGARVVAPATREKVQRIARELNYIPNSAARALATGQTGLIAILSGTMNEPYYANMVHLLEQQMNAEGYKPVLVRTPREVKDLATATGNTAVDGAIAIDMHEMVEVFRLHSAVPCVAIGTFERSFVDCVTVDLSAAVEAALSCMLAAGRQRIAYLATVHLMASAQEVRARTYLAAMEKAGRKPRIINVNTGVFEEVGTRLKINIKKNGCPDALLCQNDQTAMCAYRVLRDLGFRVPEDVLLVGCDGQLQMKYFDPPLSTIRQPMEETCATAWNFLKRRLAEPALPIQHAFLQGELVIRESLQPLNQT
ncbi:transcriptional regulator, LacI family [Abditibacterium utsteinense]|uniref:Transcriptional regulator, LacI family n=2 Tax=Abditibacterium utsteinense TaxID=1960156 RepID=A0A2S8SVE4_9BACT|nr:transcriptional regulator, LacI family [Abditibacterium utsteinense]